MCSYFQTGNAMNVQLANTSRQVYTTTNKTPSHMQGGPNVTPQLNQLFFHVHVRKYLAYQNDETFLYNVASINTQCALWYIHRPHLQPLPMKTMRTHLLWQKEALNEGIHVCYAFMVHRPRKTNKGSSRHSYSKVCLNILRSFSPCSTHNNQSMVRHNNLYMVSPKANVPQTGVT